MRTIKQTEKVLNACEEGTSILDEYINSKTSIRLQCINGHTRSIIPSNLITRGSGSVCQLCKGKSSNAKKTTEQLLEEIKALGFKGTIISEYTGAKNAVELKYECGHTAKRIPTNLLTRPAELTCSLCTYKGVKALTLQEVNNTIKGIFSYLTVVEYEKTQIPYKVLDSRCGHISTVHHSNIVHKGVYRCQVCNPKISNQERELLDFIQSKYSGWIETNDRTILEGKELDIVLPELGLAIEYNGGYWHSEEHVGSTYHLNKTENVENLEFKLVHIDEYDWTNKRQIVESRLSSMLGVSSSKVYARKCKLLEVPFPKPFLDANHIQGAGAPTKYNYALEYNGEIVAVMTFGPTRFNKDFSYELIRFCTRLDTQVVGGASKLLKYFTLRHPHSSIVSYADRAYSTGNLYEKLGFTKLGKSEPGYYYLNNNHHKLSRYQCQKNKLEKLFPAFYNENLSESQIMKSAGYYKIYNSGNLIYGLRNLLPCVA